MKLKVGMYVRTKNGITQYKEYDTNRGKLLCMPLMNGTFANIEDVLKASENIIDVIEVGDYVNGKKVDKIAFVDGEYYIKTKVSNTGNYDYLPEHLIKNIVTKEQFDSIKYEVK